MRLWSIWNLFSSFLYFVGFIIGWVFIALLLWMFLPPFFAVLLGLCVVAGIVLGVVGNVGRTRQNKRDAHAEKELQEMVRSRPKDV